MYSRPIVVVVMAWYRDAGPQSDDVAIGVNSRIGVNSNKKKLDERGIWVPLACQVWSGRSGEFLLFVQPS